MDNPFHTQPSHSESDPDTDIFKTRIPFTDEFVPETIVERDDEINTLTFVFQDLIDNIGIEDIFVYGPPGMGKRSVVRRIIEFAREEVEEEIVTTSIDCRTHNTIYQIYLALANSLSEERYVHGQAEDALLRTIFSQTDGSSVTHYFLLENLEELNKYEDLFREFEKARSEYGSPENAFGVIGFFNKPTFRKDPRSNAHHTSRINIVGFDIYDALQLEKILEYHADLAFVDGVLSPDVVPKCAAVAAMSTGSAETGLQLLELSGHIAHQLGDNQVTRDHVDLARDAYEELEVFLTFTNNLTIEEQLTCVLITTHNLVNRDKITSSLICDKYERQRKLFGLNSVSRRRIQDHIRTLKDNQLIDSTEDNTGSHGGRRFYYETIAPKKPILEGAITTSPEFERLLMQLDISIDELGTEDEISIYFEDFIDRK